MSDDIERAVLEAVGQYVYDRHADLTPSNTVGSFDEDDLERMVVEGGYLAFVVKDVHITEQEEHDDTTFWYVSATLEFCVKSGEPVEGSTDIYECYRCGDAWCISWHSS